MIGAPTFIARSITLQIFSAYASDSEPPNTVKSWLKTNTSRPSIVPCPVTTPSPRNAVSTSGLRFVTNASSSTNEFGVEQQCQSFARGQFPARVLLVDPLLPAAEQRLRAHRVKSRRALLVRRQWPILRCSNACLCARTVAIIRSQLSTEMVNNSRSVWITSVSVDRWPAVA